MVTDVEEANDAGMLERRYDSCFSLEPAITVRSGLTKGLNRDSSIQPKVVAAVDLPHAASAKLGLHSVAVGQNFSRA